MNNMFITLILLLIKIELIKISLIKKFYSLIYKMAKKVNKLIPLCSILDKILIRSLLLLNTINR